MNAEKTAVLVVTGVISVLLALTLARSQAGAGTTWSLDEKPGAEPEVSSRPAQEEPGPSPGTRVPAAGRYTIRPGDTFEKIAEKVLGGRRFARDLELANPRTDPRRLQVGQVIRLPETRGRRPGTRPSGGRREARWHVVRQGEELWRIARRYYGKTDAWPRIYRANRTVLRDPDRLLPGTRLRIP